MTYNQQMAAYMEAPRPGDRRPVARLQTYLLQIAWGLIDRALAIDSRAVLNDGPAGPIPPDVGEELHLTAKELKALAIHPDGRQVDYKSIKRSKSYQDLRSLAASLSACALQDLGKGDHLTAFWINLYNTLVIDAIMQLKVGGRVGPRLFRGAAYNICGLRFSLDDIEHGVLRGNRRHPAFQLPPFGPLDKRVQASLPALDPRVHFALVCGAHSCPPIRVYEGAALDGQLERAASSFINGDWVRLKAGNAVLEISPIFKWYARDFDQLGGIRETIARYAAHDQLRWAAREPSTEIKYQEYDWSLNAFI